MGENELDERRNDNASQANVGWMIAFLALGTMIGAVTALMLATQTGAETREDIRKGFSDIKEKLADLTDQAKIRSKELAEKGRDIIEQQKSVLKSAVDAGREAARKVREGEQPQLGGE